MYACVTLHDTNVNDIIHDCVAPHDAHTCNHIHWASVRILSVRLSCLHLHTHAPWLKFESFMSCPWPSMCVRSLHLDPPFLLLALPSAPFPLPQLNEVYGKPAQLLQRGCGRLWRPPLHRNCLKSMAHHAAGIGTYTQSGMINPSHPSSEMHLARALQWINEIEAAKSLDDLITPKSITGQDFPDYEELDLMTASALKRCYDKQTHFRKKSSVEDQRAQKDIRFFRGRQIAYLIYEYFLPKGSYDEIQGSSGLFSIELKNDDTQDFDLRWEQALLLTNDTPSDKVLEGLYVSMLQDSSQAQTIMALYNQEILRGGGQRDDHRLRLCVKLHIEQAQRSNKFRIQSEITERVAVTKGKGHNSFTKRKTGECFQWKANGSCSKGDSCSFLHAHALGNRETSAEGAKNTGVSSLKPAVDNERRRKRFWASILFCTDRKRTDWRQMLESLEGRPATGAKIPCLWVRGQNVENRRVVCGILPWHVWKQVHPRQELLVSTCWWWGETQQEVERWEYSRSSCDSERIKGRRLCISKFRSKEVYSAESWANEIERFGGTRLKILRTHLVRSSNSGKKRAISRRYPKRCSSWAKTLRAEVWGKNTWGNHTTRRVRPQSSMEFGEKNIYKVKAEDKATLYSPAEIKAPV